MFRKINGIPVALLMFAVIKFLIEPSHGNSYESIGMSRTTAVNYMQEVISHSDNGFEWYLEDDTSFPSQTIKTESITATETETDKPTGNFEWFPVDDTSLSAHRAVPASAGGEKPYVLRQLDNAVFISTDSGAIIVNPAMDN